MLVGAGLQGFLATAASADTGASGLALSTTLRDFEYAGAPLHSTVTNPDFQSYSSGLQPGLVGSTLGADGLPVFNSSGSPTSITSAASFAQWFRDTPGTNVTVHDSLTLTEIASNVYQYTSSKYYPLDGKGWNDPSYGPNAQVDSDCNDTAAHNFSFTQQIHGAFDYSSQSSPALSFTADDDLWLFINGHLAVDSGGVHGDASGSVMLDAAHAASFGLVSGQSYPFDLFKAERHTCASTFKLTLSGLRLEATTPLVSIGGVSAGATYEYGQVPAATCTATSIDGTQQISPTLSTPSNGDGTGQQTATCSYTDSAGNTTTATATYSIADTTPPAVTVSAPTTVEATGPQTAVGFTASALDRLDGPVPVSCTLDGGAIVTVGELGPVALGPHRIQCTATDSHDNTGTATATVTVADTTAPTLPTLVNYTPEFGPDGTAAATYASPADATDLVDGQDPVACAPASGAVTLTAADPSTTVTCTAVDGAGNGASGQFTITAHDADAPTITVPASVTAEATGRDGAVVPYATPTATDNVDGPRPVTCDHDPDTTFPLGITMVSCASSDTSGNVSRAAFTVTVQDTTPPAVSGHIPATFEATGPLTHPDYTASATDAVDGTVPVTCLTNPSDPSSVYTGQDVPVGPLTLFCSATDSHGNTGTITLATVVVDTMPPTVTVPGPKAVEATDPAGTPVASVALTPATASDLVDGPVTPSCTPDVSGDHFQIGTNTVTCTAVDRAGNTGQASYTVTVVDTTPPAYAPTQNVTVAGPPSGTAVNYDAPLATDSVDGVVPVSCSPAAGSIFPQGVTTVTCTAADKHHNTSSTTFTITVSDQDPPVVTVPANITAEASGPNGVTVTYPAASALDAVDGPRPTSCTPVSGSTFPLGTTTVKCDASDTSGNVGTGSFTVTVVDTTAPHITTPGALVATATATRGAAVTYTPPSATDAVDGTDPVTCTTPTQSGPMTVSAGATFAPGVTTVTCHSTDAAQNTGTATFTVTVTYGFGAFLPPINNDGTSVFKLGSTVPVKFTLAGASAGVQDAPAKLFLMRLSGTTATTGTYAASGTSASTTGNAFRYSSDHYQFNLATPGLSAGTWQLQVGLGDGDPHTVTIELR
ncbi:MAG: HYR domain-containing protein [Pseudonocardia sp.]|nr:HYR domain-containing protein [Pseudonocardia sp.]